MDGTFRGDHFLTSDRLGGGQGGQEGRADPKDPKEPGKGEQQPGAPSEKPMGGGRTTPDHWEELLRTEGELQEGREGSGTYSNSEGGEETEFDPVF